MADVATLLAPLLYVAPDAPSPTDGVAAQPHIEAFLMRLWESSAQRGTWQAVHAIEGALPLLLAAEGPTALVTLAQRVAATAPAVAP